MRSSKQRQRNKQNRQNRPSGGNIINRVFDSSGPEGKVRGTPQQIIEKYLQLHRDAQLAGDRVNAENFAQHAEHYTRLLAEAQRDIDRAREEQEQFHRERQQERERQFEQSREQRDGQNRDGQNREGREHRDFRDRERERAARFRSQDQGDSQGAPMEAGEPSFLSQPLFPVLVANPEDDATPDGGPVETPEEQPRAARGDRPRREERRFDRDERRPRRDREERQPVSAEAREAAAEQPAATAPASAEPALGASSGEAAEPARARRPRKPRAPRAEAPAEATPDAAE